MLLLGILFSSCTNTRNLSEGEYLFTKSKIKTDSKNADVANLKKYERLTPNRKVLGVRFHLYLYTRANPEKEKFPHSWLRNIGEPPIIYDSNLVIKSEVNFINFLADKGYNQAAIDLTTKISKKKARAKYDISMGEPTVINSVRYEFEDTTLRSYIFRDTVNSFLQEGSIFDKYAFQSERQRYESYLKNQGFFAFSREYIYYEVIPVDDELKVDVVVKFKENAAGVFDPVAKVRRHKRYRINEVKISPNSRLPNQLLVFDTVRYQQHFITYVGKQMIKPSTLVSANSMLPGSLYSITNQDRTYTDYASLGLFRYINVGFTEVPTYSNTEGAVNCNIDLSMRKRQSYAVDLSLTNTSGDLGIRGGVTYNNYNLFRGGEHLILGVTGAYEALNSRYGKVDSTNFDPMREIGFVSKLETPKFLLPFAADRFQRRYKPRTEFQFSFNYQSQPNYTRTIANTSFGYNWKGNVFNRHTLHPLDFYLVKLPYINEDFFNTYYKDTRLETSFTNHSILGARYSFEYNNQQLKRGISFVYLKFNFETAGLLVNQVNKMTNWGSDSLFFGVQYFQYIRTDIDFRNYNILTPRNKIVYRLFAGAGVPYGNSVSMPFEKMYWSGGPYSIRAWGERTLGPGSYSGEQTFNQLGDLKLEANLEYRFNLFWKLEGALFADAGNVWLWEDVEVETEDGIENRGGGFNISTFYKDIAIGVGTGLRFDFSFVLLRADFGFKLRDPALQDGSKWTFENPQSEFWVSTFQFGIGYPF